MIDFTVDALEETGRWRTRAVKYWAGSWERLSELIPEFKTAEFRAAPEAPANPYMKTVVRVPLTKVEQEIPVGVVSNSYGLAQHKMVVERCLDGLRYAGIEPKELRCNLGLTELGEWMNFRIQFPERFSHKPKDGQGLDLRLECFNSVDGSSRLEVLLSWFRLICTNGMIVGETRTVLSDVHNTNLDLSRITRIVGDLMGKVQADLKLLRGWEDTRFNPDQLKSWADSEVAKQWGKKAACRVFHICNSGYDVKISDPFASGEATDKPVDRIKRVPGTPEKAQTKYDVSQALSWVATRKNNPEERLQWQSGIPYLISRLDAVEC